MLCKRGFTLIEIIIVITMLGIIVAIAVPRMVANDRKDMNPLQQLNQSNDKMNYQSNDLNINSVISDTSPELWKLPVGHYRIEIDNKIITVTIKEKKTR